MHDQVRAYHCSRCKAPKHAKGERCQACGFGKGLQQFSREDLFWSHVLCDVQTHCWNWTGPRYRLGYGTIGVRRWMGERQAHRVSYTLANGPITGGLWVLHRCDNRACVNPAHLFLGTHEDNMADRDAKERQARGERQGFARLSADQVREIRAIYDAHGMTQHGLAQRFGVSRSAIQWIVERRAWKHVA